MNSKVTIDIAKQFSTEPAGRFPTDGPNSGERFRNELLLPALLSTQKVVVILDGAEGYGSSFLEEAFGGLVREGKFSAADLHDRLEIVSEEDASLVQEAWDYIDTAVSI